VQIDLGKDELLCEKQQHRTLQALLFKNQNFLHGPNMLPAKLSQQLRLQL